MHKLHIKKIFQVSIFRHESMVDLVAVLNELVDAKGKILVPGIYDSVKPLTEEEKKLYHSIDFCPVNISKMLLIFCLTKLTRLCV